MADKLSGLKTADECAKSLAPVMTAERIDELVDAGYMPCVTIDGRRFFRLKDVKGYIEGHLYQESTGERFPIVMAVPRPSDDVFAWKPPTSLLLLVDHLRVVPMGFPSSVYFLARGDEVVYIGQSVNAISRITQHAPEKDFDRAFYIPVPRSDLDRVEGALIRYFSPKLNGNPPIGDRGNDHLILAQFGLADGQDKKADEEAA